MHTSVSIGLAALLAGATLPALAADSHVALVKSVSGQVTISGGHATRPATGGAQLDIADRIVAAPGATAALVFRDGTLLTLGGGADIQVRDYVFEPKVGRYAFSLYLQKGAAIYESGRIGKLAPESVKVDTPRATVGVRGTRFLVQAD